MSTTVIQSNQIGDPADPTNATVALLAEGGLAEVNIFPVTHAPERRLWFADIPFHAPDVLDMPFFRLALARWQPDALFDYTHNSSLEARISPVIFADFMQLAPGRWASVSRQSNSHYTVTVSGFFAPPVGAAITSSMEFELQSRWYAMGADLGWRTIERAESLSTPSIGGQRNFVYTPPTQESPVGQWTMEVHLPHSALFRKYRVLIRKKEHFAVPANEAGSGDQNPSRAVFTQFIDLP